jgi:hypothetical protein
MFGISRLNSIAKGAAADAGARASAATYSNGSGTPTVPTTGGKFGGYFNAAADQTGSITVSPTDTTWYLDSAKTWTVEFWLKVSDTAWSASANQILVNLWPAGSSTGCSLATTGATNTIGLNLGGTQRVTTTLSTTFQHFALVNSAGSLKFYKNGTSLVTASWSNNYSQRAMRFGQDFNPGSLNIMFDEIRISNSQRYTSNFTAPTSAFTNDANTLALFHFDSGLKTDDTA